MKIRPNYINEINEVDSYKLKQFVHYVLEQSNVEADGERLESNDLALKIKLAWRECLEASRIDRQSRENSPPNIHITSGLSNAGTLKVSLSKAGIRESSMVYSFEDFYSVGPLRHIDEERFEMERFLWMMNHLGYDHFWANGLHHVSAMKPILAKIPNNKRITIWAGNNAHDYIFTRLVLYLLRDVKAEICLVNITEEYERLLPADRPSSIDEDIERLTLGQLQTEDVAYLLLNTSGKILNADKREKLANEWLGLSSRSEMLRVWKEGELQFLPDNAYDEIIMEIIREQYSSIHLIEDEDVRHKDFILAGHLMDPILKRCPELMSVAFIEYRFRSLIAEKRLDFTGVPGVSNRYYVKPKSGITFF
ncbi:DUF1835 domain-containing protein [Neobacillus mesonae]|nr:DUF1835 domain-containing protein [Neobacillus mesonae]